MIVALNETTQVILGLVHLERNRPLRMNSMDWWELMPPLLPRGERIYIRSDYDPYSDDADQHGNPYMHHFTVIYYMDIHTKTRSLANISRKRNYDFLLDC